MTTLLFLNQTYGVDFMLKRRLEAEKIEHEFISLIGDNSKENQKLYKKYNVKSTPVLIVLDKKEEVDRITGVEDIVKHLKDNRENV